MQNKISLVVLLFVYACGSISLADEGWFTDANRAVAKASKENKDLLLLYTGSDWCPPCKKLEAEVFSQDGFVDEVTGEYVLVKFDFPKQKQLPAETQKQNEEWAEKFGVGSYPTVVLADKDLVPFAIVGYEEGGVENYLGMLEEKRQLRIERDKRMSEAAKVEGPEKAKLLDLAIAKMDPKIVEVYYSEVVKEIVEIDKDDQLGLRSKWNEAKDAEIRKLILSDILMISRLEKPARAIQFINEVTSEIKFPEDQMLEILQIKLPLVRALNDNKKLDAHLDEMINLPGVEGETKERLIVKKIYLMVGTDRKPAAWKLLEESIAAGGSNLYLYLAKGELLMLDKSYSEAIEVYDKALAGAGGAPDVYVELITAKADALMELDKPQEALQTLDNFADDSQMPSDLRVEALLHQSLILRQRGRSRQARLAENRAIEICESNQEKAATQKLVERLRKKFDEGDR